MPTPSLDAEIQRLQCLQALGITVYHPRYRLPGAKPSVKGPWPDAADAGRRIEDSHVADPGAGARQESGGIAELRRDDAPAATPRASARMALDAQVSTAKDVPSAVAPRKPESAAVPVQNFQLLFLRIDADLAVINQIPALARPQLNDRQMTLLANLLRWLGRSVPAQAPRIFRWPLPGLEHMAASMSADTSLLHFLEQACTESPFRYVLHLGPQAFAAPSPTWQSFATHSLDEMLALPALKREAWQALLPLHALLHASA